MTNPPTDEIERVARVIFAVTADQIGADPSYATIPEQSKEKVRQVATAAIAAMDTSLREQIAAKDEALRPFATYADPHNRFPPNLSITVGSEIAKRQLTMGDCYKALAALTNTQAVLEGDDRDDK